MIQIYQNLEHTLLALLFLRLGVAWIKGYRFESKNIEILLFFLIWFLQSIIVWTLPNSTLAFYFVHCSFPVVIFGASIFKSRPLILSLVLILSIGLNIYFHKQIIIEITYLISYFFILKRITKLGVSGRKNRNVIPIYVTILIALILTHIVYMFGIVRVQWDKSIYADYFLYFVIVTYLASLTLIHAQLSRFITH
jgi:hypothetical protein